MASKREQSATETNRVRNRIATLETDDAGVLIPRSSAGRLSPTECCPALVHRPQRPITITSRPLDVSDCAVVEIPPASARPIGDRLGSSSALFHTSTAFDGRPSSSSIDRRPSPTYQSPFVAGRTPTVSPPSRAPDADANGNCQQDDFGADINASFDRMRVGDGPDRSGRTSSASATGTTVELTPSNVVNDVRRGPPTIEIADYCRQNDDGDTLLHIVIMDERVNLQFVNTLVAVAPSPTCLDVANLRGLTPLHVAIYVDLPDVVRWLMAAGASVECRENLYGDTPMLLACRYGRGECFLVVVEELKRRAFGAAALKKALQTTDYNGQACIHLAAKLADRSLIYEMVYNDGYPVDINQQEWKRGMTVLHMAADRDDCVLLETLIGLSVIDVARETYDNLAAHDMVRSPKAAAILNRKPHSPRLYASSDDEIMDAD